MEYDPFDRALQIDPYPVYRWLRDEAPLYHNAKRDLYVVSRYADVLATVSDWERFSNREGVDIDKTDSLLAPDNMDEKDPPEHDELRKLLQWWFSPKAFRDRLENPMRLETRRLVSAMLERDEVDLTDGLANELPTFVVARMFDLPEEDRDQLRSFMAPVFARLPNDPVPPPAAFEAGTQIEQYFREAIRRRRREPLGGRDDILSVLVRSELRGRALTEDQVLGSVAHLFVASSGTTQDAISNTLALLAQHPDERAKLLADPAEIPNAVEESLRFETVIQNVSRVTNHDVELHGLTIPAGKTVVNLLGSANRDERYWEDPDRFDVSRTPRRHLTFAAGVHHCIGAPIARFETRIAVEEVLRAMPDYELSRTPAHAVSHVARGYAAVWVRPKLRSKAAA